MQRISLNTLPNGELALPSVFKNTDGRPRFFIPLPKNAAFVENDPGRVYMINNEVNNGGCEYAMRRFFDAHIEAGDGFIDVGAHWGLFSLTVGAKFPGHIDVVAIEAHPYNALRLTQSIAANELTQSIEVINCALNNHCGTVKLVGGYGTMCHSINGDGHPASADVRRAFITSPSLTLDTILAERPELMKKRLFVKIDVEGAECEVMAGARRLVEGGLVAAFVIEKGIYFRQEPALSKFGELLISLSQLGYKHYRLSADKSNPQLLPYTLCEESGDIVSVRPSLSLLNRYD